MKIAYDAKRITNNLTGLGNYSRFVVNNLAKEFPSDEFLMLSPDKAKDGIKELINNSLNLRFISPSNNLKGIGKALWRSWCISKDIVSIKPDLYHGLTNELPFSIKKTGITSVVTIHDLIFLHYPKFYKVIDRFIYNYKFKKACKAASHIVAVSECTKNDIIKFYNIAPEKISVIYQGCNSQFMIKANKETRHNIAKKFDLPKDFILSVGTIEERKNLLLTLKALNKSELNNKLIVIGKRTKYAKKVDKFIADNDMQDQVIFLNNVGADELPVIYQLASLFVYPSLYEGFGIPIIEALHSNIPVIAATGSCLEEAGGECTLYVNPYNHIELAKCMELVLGDKTVCENMIYEGAKHIKKFEHNELTLQMMNLYKTLVVSE